MPVADGFVDVVIGSAELEAGTMTRRVVTAARSNGARPGASAP